MAIRGRFQAPRRNKDCQRGQNFYTCDSKSGAAGFLRASEIQGLTSMNKNRYSLTLVLSASCLLAGTTLAEEKIDFATQIYPFVKESCSDCHRPAYKDERGRMKKPKADLIVTNKNDLLNSGESGPTVIPGKPDESEFLRRTLLPLDDDDHQPPVGKAPQWTSAEKELFRKWIAQGADFGSWTEDPAPDDLPKWDGTEYPDDHIRTAK
jgi:hypothetical protein